MPYDIEKVGKKFCVIKRDDGKNMGCHASRAEAEKQRAAIHANEGASAMSEGPFTIDAEMSTSSASPETGWITPQVTGGWLNGAREALGISYSNGVGTMTVTTNNTGQESYAEEPVEAVEASDDRGEPWEGILALEGAPTSDGRMLIAGEISDRELPLPINAQFVTDEGHKHSECVGRIEEIERLSIGEFQHPDFDLSGFDLPETTVIIWATGTFSLSPEADKAQGMIDNGAGISIDLPTERVALFDKNTMEEVDISGLTEEDLIFGEFIEGAAGKIGGATIVTVPAFEEARIQISREQVLVASAYGMKVKRVSALTAAAGPVKPPAEWLKDPELSELTPLTITKDGRVFGHLADWGGCHVGFQGICVPPFRSRSDYAYFNTGEIETAEGDLVPCGKIMFSRSGAGHAPTDDSSMDHEDVQSYYDNATKVGAFVRAGSDRFGTWLAGSLRPGLSDLDIQHLRTHPPSGDWRPVRGEGELIAAFAVPVPGFPIARQALVASADGRIMAIISAPLSVDDEMGSKKRWRKKKMLSERMVTALGHKPSSKARLRRQMMEESEKTPA